MNWNSTLNASTKPMKRSRIAPVSKKRLDRKREAIERYRDCHGIAFDEVRGYMEKHFGLKCSDWPTIKRIDDPLVLQHMHSWFDSEAICWGCGKVIIGVYPPLEAHHIEGGTKGRSDEFCNLAMICSNCHVDVHASTIPKGKVLFLKWSQDRQHTDWIRMTLLRGHYLPELITP